MCGMFGVIFKSHRKELGIFFWKKEDGSPMEDMIRWGCGLFPSEQLFPLLSDLEIRVPAINTFFNQGVFILCLSLKLARLKLMPDEKVEKDLLNLPSLINRATGETGPEYKRTAPLLDESPSLYYYLGQGRVMEPVWKLL